MVHKTSNSISDRQFAPHDAPSPRKVSEASNNGSWKRLRHLATLAVALSSARFTDAVQSTDMASPPEGQTEKNCRLYQIEFKPFGFAGGNSNAFESWAGTKNTGAKLVEAGLTEQECLALQTLQSKMGAVIGKIETFPKDGNYPIFHEISENLPKDIFFCYNTQTQQIVETHHTP